MPSASPGRWEDLVELALDEIRAFGAGQYQVARRLRALLDALRADLPEHRRPALEAQSVAAGRRGRALIQPDPACRRTRPRSPRHRHVAPRAGQWTLSRDDEGGGDFFRLEAELATLAFDRVDASRPLGLMELDGLVATVVAASFQENRCPRQKPAFRFVSRWVRGSGRAALRGDAHDSLAEATARPLTASCDDGQGTSAADRSWHVRRRYREFTRRG